MKAHERGHFLDAIVRFIIGLSVNDNAIIRGNTAPSNCNAFFIVPKAAVIVPRLIMSSRDFMTSDRAEDVSLTSFVLRLAIFNATFKAAPFEASVDRPWPIAHNPRDTWDSRGLPDEHKYMGKQWPDPLLFQRKWRKLNYETISDELVIGIQQGHINQTQLITTMSNLCATYFGFQDILDLVYNQEIIQKRALTSFVHHDFNSVNMTKNASLKNTVDAILIAPFRTLMSRTAEDDISLEFVLFIMGLIESKPTSKDQLESQLIWNLFNESLSGRLMNSLVESVDLKEDGPYLQAGSLYRYFGCHSGAEIIYQTLWEEHVYSKSRNQSSPPCDDANHSLLISNCCKVLTFLNQNIRPVLQVIKYSIQSPTMMQSLEEHESDFGHTSLFPNYPQIRAPNAKEKLKIKERLKYGRPPSFSPQISMMRNPRSRVFVCYFGDKKGFPSPFECEGFYRKIGNQGLTFTYNGGKFWDHYQVTPTSTLFYECLLSDNKNEKGQAQRYPGTKDRGNTFSMILRLDPDLELVQHRHSQLASSFKLNLHDPLDVPDFQSSFIEIKPMYEYTINVVPFLTSVSKDFEKLDQRYRECRLLTETKGLRFFKHYTQTGCIYECQINYARAKCGCTPWNVPNLHSNWRLCDFYGNSCFQYVLSSLDTSECDCPVNCNLGRYEYSVTALNMQPERLCRDSYDFDLFNSLVDPIYIGTKQFAQTTRQLLRNESESKLEQCLRKVKRLALVRVQLGSQTVTVAQKDVRVTVGLMLSNLGELMAEVAERLGNDSMMFHFPFQVAQ
ncbi:hypothetical protein TCAL_17274 [Tigriopus californicus]|uniref:Uncharacterized protein n=1 Tax=Tigriopus californicus TaxID=6832 RepID=A0A553NXN8_TIGCA|nr:hypothetical protein TCAL_17274 [Tigriopus californicus]